MPDVGSLWKHWKLGHNYIVLCVGRHTENQDELVVYARDSLPARLAAAVLKRLTGTVSESVWLRPRAMWEDDARPGVKRFESVPAEQSAAGGIDVELLAAAEHESWAGWTKYMLRSIETEMTTELGQLTARSTLALFDSLPCVKRWRRQVNASYADLPDHERESDRAEARKKLHAWTGQQ